MPSLSIQIKVSSPLSSCHGPTPLSHFVSAVMYGAATSPQGLSERMTENRRVQGDTPGLELTDTSAAVEAGRFMDLGAWEARPCAFVARQAVFTRAEP